MLILSKLLINQSVLSLRTGGVVAVSREAIINPTNLKIEGFYCSDSFEKNKILVLIKHDIRDVLPAGIVVNDHGVLSEPEDLIRLKEVMDWDYQLTGKQVVTESKKKLGKVSDYATDPDTMIIQKLYVVQPVLRNLTGGSLSIDRQQIVEINKNKIIVKDLLQPVKTRVPASEPLPAS